MIHPEAKLFSSCEHVKLDKLYTSKIRWWDGRGRNIPILKGTNRKEERDDGSQVSPNIERQILAFKCQESSSLAQCPISQAHWGGSITLTDARLVLLL